MTTLITYLIVPAWSDQAGQCRIVAKRHHERDDEDVSPHPGLKDYRADPSQWFEVGIMNSQGHIVCLSPTHPSHYPYIQQDEPLMAGLAYTFIDGVEAS